MNKVGKYIKELRKSKGMTQKELAEKLFISFQAISKWENGESLPDTSILLDLASELDTNVNLLLNAGSMVYKNIRFMSISDVVKGFESIENVGKYFGKNSTFYLGMIEGINKKMNMDLEKYLSDAKTREVLITEVIVQHIMDGGKIDINEVKDYIENQKMIDVIKSYL